MKIKVKVKNIILVLLTCVFIYLVLIPIASLGIADYLDSKVSDKSTMFYESFLSKSFLWNRSKALYKYGSGLMGYEDKYQLFMNMSGGMQFKSMNNTEKGLKALEEILNNKDKSKKDMEYTLLAYPKIMNAYIQLQSPDDLIHWIDWGQENDNEKINYISDLYLSFYHIVNRKYDLAEKVLDKYKEDMEVVDYRYYYAKGELALWQGDMESSKRYFDSAPTNGEVYLDNRSNLFGSASYGYREYWLQEDYPNIRGNTTVKGKVKFNGKPMPFVEIYLQKNNRGLRVGGNDLVGITDINGEYETLGFDPSRYDIGVGMSGLVLQNKVFQSPGLNYIDLNYTQDFNFSFVSPFNITSPKEDILVRDNTFTLEWDHVAGADYYEVQTIIFDDLANKSSGNFSFIMEDENSNHQIKNNKAVFDINKLKRSQGAIYYSGDKMRVSPSAILGPFIPGNDYYFVVSAYDNSSNLINSTVGMRTFYEDFIKVSVAGKLTEGESLIQGMEYEKAIDYYTNLLAGDSNNQEALLYLSKIYMVGYEDDKQDHDKALEYAIRYDDLNNDNLLTYQVIQLMNHSSIRKHKDLVKEVLDEIEKENKDENIHYYLADYYLSLKEYDLAKSSLEKADYYNKLQIMYIDLYNGDIESVLESLNLGDLNFYNIDDSQFKNIVEKIDSDTIKSRDFGFIKDVIENILSEDIDSSKRKNSYSEARSKIQDSNLRRLLDQIAMEEDQ